MVWDEETFDEDLKQAMREDEARGRKRNIPDPEIIKERKRVKKEFRDLLRKGIGEKDFKKALTDVCGLQEGSEQYNLALEVWKDFRVPRKR
jgi:SOS response regulatory protein OraA/RecX